MVTDLLELSDDEMRHVRGERISVIFQDPLTSLHPSTIGWQIMDDPPHDKSVSKRKRRPRSFRAASGGRHPQAGDRVNDDPHSSSGGCGSAR